MLLDQSYVNLKNQAIKAERRVLKELGFCVHVKHPHKVSACKVCAIRYGKLETSLDFIIISFSS